MTDEQKVYIRGVKGRGIDVIAWPEGVIVSAEVINWCSADLAEFSTIPKFLVSANRAENDAIVAICQCSCVFDNPNSLFAA